MVVRGRHGHERSGQVVGHQAAQPSTTSGQGQKILGRGQVSRCVSTNAGTRRSGAPRRGSRRGRQGQQGHPGKEARDAPRYEHEKRDLDRTAQGNHAGSFRPRAAAPRAARRDEHKSERQRATARNGRPRPPPRQHRSRREADARRAVIREAKRAESPARPGRKADQESPLRGGGERGGAFWVVQLHRNSAEKCL